MESGRHLSQLSCLLSALRLPILPRTTTVRHSEFNREETDSPTGPPAPACSQLLAALQLSCSIVASAAAGTSQKEETIARNALAAQPRGRRGGARARSFYANGIDQPRRRIPRWMFPFSTSPPLRNALRRHKANRSAELCR